MYCWAGAITVTITSQDATKIKKTIFKNDGICWILPQNFGVVLKTTLFLRQHLFFKLVNGNLYIIILKISLEKCLFLNFFGATAFSRNYYGIDKIF